MELMRYFNIYFSICFNRNSSSINTSTDCSNIWMRQKANRCNIRYLLTAMAHSKPMCWRLASLARAPRKMRFVLGTLTSPRMVQKRRARKFYRTQETFLLRWIHRSCRCGTCMMDSYSTCLSKLKFFRFNILSEISFSGWKTLRWRIERLETETTSKPRQSGWVQFSRPHSNLTQTTITQNSTIQHSRRT